MLSFLRREGVNEEIVSGIEAFRAAHGVSPEAEHRLIKKPRYEYYGKEVWEAAATALLCGENLLPVGVAGAVNGQSRVVHLAAGDLAVLVSDGLLVDGSGWVLKQLELAGASGDSPDKIARDLVDTARARAENTGRPDDITAAVLRLEVY